MSTFSLSPFEMGVLMHYARRSGEPFESNAAEHLTRETHCNLSHYGLLFTSSGGVRYEITDRGLAWLDMALSTPLPVQKWVRP